MTQFKTRRLIRSNLEENNQQQQGSLRLLNSSVSVDVTIAAVAVGSVAVTAGIGSTASLGHFSDLNVVHFKIIVMNGERRKGEMLKR